jgi:hypothetical protein
MLSVADFAASADTTLPVLKIASTGRFTTRRKDR